MNKYILISVGLLVAALSGCTTILRADFESDAVDSIPAADIVGPPEGDRLFVSAPRYGSVFFVDEVVVDGAATRRLTIENRADLSEPGWHTNLDGFNATRFISREIRFPDRPIGTTFRGTIVSGSGRLDMYFGDENNCAALRLRFENNRVFRLSDDSEAIADLGELQAGLPFSLTTFVNRAENNVSLFFASRPPNSQWTFSLPDCASTSLWDRQVFKIGFVSPAHRTSRVKIDVVEMSENNRGE